MPSEHVEPGPGPRWAPPLPALGAPHSAVQELAMQRLRSVVGASSEHAPPLVHWAHVASAKHAVTCEQQLCSRHMPHALLVLRWDWQLQSLPPPPPPPPKSPPAPLPPPDPPPEHELLSLEEPPQPSSPIHVMARKVMQIPRVFILLLRSAITVSG